MQDFLCNKDFRKKVYIMIDLYEQKFQIRYFQLFFGKIFMGRYNNKYFSKERIVKYFK